MSESSKCCLYRVIHVDSQRVYIGISVNPKARWIAHLSNARKQNGHYFHRALAKGKSHSTERVEKMRLALKGKTKGIKKSEKTKQAMREASVNRSRLNGRFI